MSVPVNERSRGKLEACVKARELCAYTIKITSNQKIFNPEYQQALTDRSVKAALEVHTMSWSANNVLVNSAVDMQRRLDYQDRAADASNNLLSLIEIAKPVFHLATKRVTYWSGLAIETRKLLLAWRDADRKRYSAKFK